MKYNILIKNISKAVLKAINESELNELENSTISSALTKAKNAYNMTNNKYERKIRQRLINTFSNYLNNLIYDYSHIEFKTDNYGNDWGNTFMSMLKKYREIDPSKISYITVTGDHWNVYFDFDYNDKTFSCEFNMYDDYTWNIDLDYKFKDYIKEHEDELYSEDPDDEIDCNNVCYIILEALLTYIDK